MAFLRLSISLDVMTLRFKRALGGASSTAHSYRLTPSDHTSPRRPAFDLHSCTSGAAYNPVCQPIHTHVAKGSKHVWQKEASVCVRSGP